ncbi:MAG: hypothetical protein ACXQTD_08965 [Candidatus Syntropharchaeia archaeon]
MGDILHQLRIFFSSEIDRKEIERYFGSDVKLILVKKMPEPWEGTNLIKILFSGGYFIDARYHHLDHLKKTGEECDFQLKKIWRGNSGIRYDVGFTRLWIEYPDDWAVRMLLERIYRPMLLKMYKPVIPELRGFYRRDYFGVEVNKAFISAYYSPVRKGSEEENAEVTEVLSRLERIERVIKEMKESMEGAEEDLRSRLRGICRAL